MSFYLIKNLFSLLNSYFGLKGSKGYVIMFIDYSIETET